MGLGSHPNLNNRLRSIKDTQLSVEFELFLKELRAGGHHSSVVRRGAYRVVAEAALGAGQRSVFGTRFIQKDRDRS